MPLPELTFSILIVNYNGLNCLPACLDALQAQDFPSTGYEVLIFDNASTDGSNLTLPERYPHTRWYTAQANVGFAEANNRLTLLARAPWFVLLNPDTIPDPAWLRELARAAKLYPGSLLASKLLLAEQPTHYNSAGLFLLRDGRGADRAFLEPDRGEYEAGGLVFGGCAAALAVPCAVLQNQPLFDPRLFLYCEDLELAWRLQKRGIRTQFCPRSVVLHQVGARNDASPRHTFYSERNRVLVAWRHGGLLLASFTTLGYVARCLRAGVSFCVGSHVPKYQRPHVLALLQVAPALLKYWITATSSMPQTINSNATTTLQGTPCA